MNRKMIQAALGLAFSAAIGLAGCQAGTPAPTPSPSATPATVQTEEQKIVYAVGVMLGSNVANLNFTPEELELLKKGLTDSATGKKPDIDMAQFGPKIQAFAEGRAKARAVAERGF